MAMIPGLAAFRAPETGDWRRDCILGSGREGPENFGPLPGESFDEICFRFVVSLSLLSGG